jgi:hypothetical protein
MAHSFLPPSGAAAWSRCALWPLMNQRYPQDDTAESIEGTAAHWVATEMIAGRIHPEGSPTLNGVFVTGEMIDGAELIAEVVTARMGGLTLHIEEQIAAPRIHPDCFGTPDVWARTGSTNRIEIVDYKFGHGFVDEYFNPQGLIYLAGILDREYNVDKIDPNISVSFTVVQPRCFNRGAPVRTHTFTVRETQPYMLAFVAAAEAAMQPQPTSTTNDECGHCPGRHACSVLQQSAYLAAEMSSDRVPFDLTPKAAGLELRMLERAQERLTARVDGLRELTLANLRRGDAVPYYGLEASKGRAQWTLPTEQLIAVGKLLGKDLAKPSVVTPAQAKKLGVDDAVILAYSENTLGTQKLVKRNNVTLRNVFGNGIPDDIGREKG